MSSLTLDLYILDAILTSPHSVDGVESGKLGVAGIQMV